MRTFGKGESHAHLNPPSTPTSAWCLYQTWSRGRQLFGLANQQMNNSQRACSSARCFLLAISATITLAAILQLDNLNLKLTL